MVLSLAPRADAVDTLADVDAFLRDMADDLLQGIDPVETAIAGGITPYAWQARVLRSDARQQILNCSRQAGKSSVSAVLPVHEAIYYPGSLTLILSPSERQSGELFRKCKDIYHALGQPVKADKDNDFGLELLNGSRIVALPGKEGTIRGFSGVDLLVIDEASKVPDATYYAVRPMLAASGGRLLLLSTPFGKRGFFHRAWTEGGETWERTMITADQVPHITPEFLEEERINLPELWYRQEYGVEFVALDNAFFSHDLLVASLTDEFEPLFGGIDR